MQAGQAPLEFHLLGETQDDQVPERFAEEDRTPL